ncbi:transcriptional regulator family: GATA type zinc finger [Penicillium longicatenatum]|nr:transcriptional regulator family: GATA type zinc finger [Penicillium longicatenatum]
MICNACGLYLKARNVARPTKRNRVQQTLDGPESKPPTAPHEHTTTSEGGCKGSCPGGGSCNGTGGAEGCDGCPAYNNRIYKSAPRGVLILLGVALQPLMPDKRLLRPSLRLRRRTLLLIAMEHWLRARTVGQL